MHLSLLKFTEGEIILKHKITVIGLGAGDLEQLPLGVYRKLINANDPVFVRTIDHPVIKALETEGVSFRGFDDYYEQEDQFESVYERIAQTLLKEARDTSLIYAVPGHPMLAEFTVQLLLGQKEVEVEISGGQSYLDDLFTSLRIDPIDGFQFLDGTAFERSQINYEQHLIFCQVYDRYIASEVKLALLEDLPADYQIKIVEAAGSDLEVITTVSIEELDRSIEMSNLISVYVPPVPKEMLNHRFSRLKEIIEILRGPGGCEWDREQTHESLRNHLIEESYELIDAINAQDDELIVEELGDVLLHVMLHSQIGSDAGYFTIDDVIKGITTKMIHRHPHVFSDDPNKVAMSWDELKQVEKPGQRDSLFDNIGKGLPSLSKARKIQVEAAKIGFDWDDVNKIWLKLDEEIKEVQEAIELGDPKAIEDEIGDVLFVITNLARHNQIDATIALNHANQKFMMRMNHIENRVAEQNKDIYQTPLEEMYEYWNETKRKGD